METSVTLRFADGSYRFWLPMSCWLAAQREAGKKGEDASLFAIYHDIQQNVAALGDDFIIVGPLGDTLKACQKVIKYALIGGNFGTVDGENISVPEEMAADLVATYCYPARPALRDIALAHDILRAALDGIRVKKNEEPVTTTARSRRSKKAKSSSMSDGSASTGKD